MRKRLHPVGSAKRLRILKRDNYTCVYCFEGATEVDHILPYSYKADNSDANLVASCGECNRLASNMVFTTFNEKYMYIKRRRQQRGERVNPEWQARAVRAMMDEIPEPVKVVKPKRVKAVKAPKVKVEKPPKPKVEKPKPIVEKITRPKRHYYPPLPPIPTRPPDSQEFVAGMYEYYAKRNTPTYIREIFERWLMLKTTKEWAAKNGRLLPTVASCQSLNI